MRFKEAMEKCRELGNKVQEHSNTAARAAMTYEATMTLFSVAADAGDEKSMELHRDTLHTTVDSILDSRHSIAVLQREIQTVAQSVTDFPE
jgi:hypothetical protein